jgi:RNA polymerase sigma-70 factor, ECF subfamily
MLSDASFADVMGRLQAGDKDAARKVFRRFAGQLIALAREHLDAKMRQKLDPEDVTQSVFRSFFAHQAAGEMDDLAGWDNLWGMLVIMTLRKCHRKKTYFHAERRDIDREVPLTGAMDAFGTGWEPIDREPTPAEAAALADAVEQMVECFSGRHQEIVTLLLHGYSAPEISDALGCTERSVYRIYERARGWLCGLDSE